ncbi:hypothetical protein H261_05544 [Paramagnetospirillum caucaseum]|uniref:PD-(D/E)XK endonuclease-like domain-containing protein n=1 Tax=Paramagnetospirillum caucaseum TaxID=1244869 RepID=M3AEN8_9PROT|nr:hypothetical protein [Paramagnetospirillum caucaseum]EME71024.1 hypothetical protein H261_05544 [Paramagnetospirillum caucaseum]
MIDLNHGSGSIYSGTPVQATAAEINRLLDMALEAERQAQPPRTYLGASRIGEPCSRRLAFEMMAVPVDEGRGFDGQVLRIFDAGHVFETLSIRWLRAAGFDLRTERRDGGQFGFSVAGGRIRGHIDGVIVAGPDVSLPWPALWEHKALNARSWEDLVKKGLKESKPLYWAQVQIYMAYLDVPVTLFSALNKNTQELFHEPVRFDPTDAQALSDRAVAILRAVDAHELPPRIAANSDHWLCRFCDYAQRCWEQTS